MRRPALALLLGCLLLVAGASALDGYSYYQTIEYAGCDQEIYQQDIIIHRSAGTAYNETIGGLETWHIFVGDHCLDDYGDIRFTNSTGAELAYYLWPDYTNSSARFCVRLEGANEAGTLTVWYGNSTATTTSDGDSVYIDFVDGSTTSGWTSATGSLPTATNGELRWTSPTQITYRTAQVNGHTTPVLVEYRAKHQNCRMFGLSKTSPTVADFENWIGPDSQVQRFGAEYNDDNYEVSTAPIENQYALYKILWTASDVYIYENGVQKLHKTSNIPNYLAGFTAYIYSLDSSPYLYLDWLTIRAYSATPPAALTFSGERETAAPLQPFPGCSNDPTDPDADGLYEDINGNARWDFQDIILFFQHLTWCEANQPVSLFDWNSNGRCDFDDVFRLWSNGGMI